MLPKYILGPTRSENALIESNICGKLLRLSPNERLCAYDRILFRLRQTDKKVAEALERHWEDHIKPR